MSNTESKAHILDWTMNNYEDLLASLKTEGFTITSEKDSKNVYISIAQKRLLLFIKFIQAHLNSTFNYVDIQYPESKQTVLVFKQEHFFINNERENENIKNWAVNHGLPEQQADWYTSF